MIRFLSLFLALAVIGFSQTQFGIVYSSKTGRIRSIVRPDKDADLNGIRVGTGEALLKTVNANYGELETLQSFLNIQTGLVPLNDRYAIVDGLGNVVGAVVADPLCGDAIVGFQLISHPLAVPGWHWDLIGGFVDLRPLFTRVVVDVIPPANR